MGKRNLNILSVIATIVFVIFAFGSDDSGYNNEDKTADINNKEDVIDDMQGTWIGNSHDGYDGGYIHYKLEIKGDKYKGWITVAYTNSEPSWAANPDSKGSFSLGPVLTYTNSSGNFRNILFIDNANGEAIDNSTVTNTIQSAIIYDDFSGLYVAGWGPMTKK